MEGYRNKGALGSWNLDELMMALAIRVAFEMGERVFTIRPTGDKLEYYRQKYGAVIQPSFGGDTIVGIEIKTAFQNMSHVRWGESNGESQTVFFKCKPDR